jgi:hypothetical protein
VYLGITNEHGKSEEEENLIIGDMFDVDTLGEAFKA